MRGTVTVNGSPAQRQVLLFKRDGRLGVALIAETYSGSDGAYIFDGLSAGTYLVIGVDMTGTYNAIVHDHIQAEPMPA